MTGTVGWQQVTKLRKAADSPAAFDALLERELHLVTKTPPSQAYPTLTRVWQAFEGCLNVAGGLVFYQPVHQQYLKRAFELFAADGIQLVELRQVLQGDIGRVYTLNGTVLPLEYTVTAIAAAAKAVSATTEATTAREAAERRRFLQRKLTHVPLNPPPKPSPYCGYAPVIACGLRIFDAPTVTTALNEAAGLAAKLPAGWVTGFDLVGQEDPGKPLTAFVEMLLDYADHPGRSELGYFFHAGETNVVGGPADLNLFDAIMLNASRIGHGYGLGRHPSLRAEIKNKGTAVEVCPLSNQVLKLVDDLRNHPVHGMLAEGLPVVVSPDDPAIWGAVGSSFDWAMLYFAMDKRAGGLATLKQLAINSIQRHYWC